MPTIFQSIILGLVQGATELFPVSSLGHAVVLPAFFGWNLNQGQEGFLVFLIATHLATSLVLLAFFFKDWLKIIGGIFRSIVHRRIDQNDVYAKLGWLLILGTVPAGLLGLLFESKIKHLFALPAFAATFLVLNGLLLWGMENYKRRVVARAQNRGEIFHSDEPADKQLTKLSWKDALKVGVAQCLALIPGFSRTGATMAGGLYVGLDHKLAARFSFLLATPIILAASVLKLPELVHMRGDGYLTIVLIGMITAAIASYLSVRYLTRYFETNNLKRFALYCIVVGFVVLIRLAM